MASDDSRQSLLKCLGSATPSDLEEGLVFSANVCTYSGELAYTGMRMFSRLVQLLTNSVEIADEMGGKDPNQLKLRR
jgi:hypothetical protein